MISRIILCAALVGLAPAAYAQDNDVILGHFGAGLTPTQATFAGAALMDFEFADDAAFDLLYCNTLSAGDADVINTTLALIEPSLDEVTIGEMVRHG